MSACLIKISIKNIMNMKAGLSIPNSLRLVYLSNKKKIKNILQIFRF